MTDLHVLRVFTGPEGRGGNLLGVFLDGRAVPPVERQSVAAELGFSETVFVDDVDRGEVRIFTPAAELPFAGHPLVGTAWLLARERGSVAALRPPAGEVATWPEDGAVFIRARPNWAPAFALVELASAEKVDALQGPPRDHGLVDAWAWLDRPAGVVRARVFAPELGVAEDEATGAAAVLLGAHVGRAIVIHQGRGSRIQARPGPEGTVEVGGRVELDDVRPFP